MKSVVLARLDEHTPVTLAVLMNISYLSLWRVVLANSC
jgi:hypothetical protein